MVQRVMVATEGSDNARRAEVVASEIARGLGASLVLVHVVIERPTDQDLTGMANVVRSLGPQRSATLSADNLAKHVQQSTGAEGIYTNADALRAVGERLLENAAIRAGDAGVEDVETRLEFGDPGRILVDVARGDEADLVVVGTRGIGGLRGRLAGSVSQRVLKEAPQNTLVVKD